MLSLHKQKKIMNTLSKVSMLTGLLFCMQSATLTYAQEAAIAVPIVEDKPDIKPEVKSEQKTEDKIEQVSDIPKNSDVAEKKHSKPKPKNNIATSKTPASKITSKTTAATAITENKAVANESKSSAPVALPTLAAAVAAKTITPALPTPSINNATSSVPAEAMITANKNTTPTPSSPIAAQNTANANTDKAFIQDDVMSQYGQIIQKKELKDGLIAWIIEKNGKRILLYTNANKSIVIHGVAWDIKSKQNLNLAFYADLAFNNGYKKQANINQNTQNIQNTDWKDKKFPLPDIIKALDQNTYGVKEGNASSLDMAYIFFDPRCPYCHTAYQQARNYIAQGKTIKWIPTLILGDSQLDSAQMQIASILQSALPKQADMLNKLFNAKNMPDVKATPKTIQQIANNEQALRILSEKYLGNQIVLPVAFYFDKRTASMKYIKGIQAPDAMANMFKGI